VDCNAREKGGGGGTCEETPDHELDGEHPAFAHEGDVGIRHAQQGVGHDPLGLLHPPRTGLVQNLTLQQNVSSGLIQILILQHIWSSGLVQSLTCSK